MPSVRLVRSATLTDTVDYAYASVVPAGTRLVHLAGACPLDTEGRTVAPGDPVAQAHQVVANLRQALADAGAGLTDVAFTRVLVASSEQADLVAVWNVVRAAFGDHDVPSTLLGVTVLGYPDQIVEVEATAVLRD
ncbi:Rid family hydrolase [Isoptericola halotolerans]|uniref:Rid family hydrolase n=1 Tax=Isoptericola halotolerans TaxID=300560 RepID=UPI0038911220